MTTRLLLLLLVSLALPPPLAAAGPLDITETVAVVGRPATLRCASAERLVRTHMAPDFVSPQLVRRLDWAKDDDQHLGVFILGEGGAGEEWFVRSDRLLLERPFFSLLIHAVRADDAGDYACRLDADPLFLDEGTPRRNTVRLRVLDVPATPLDVQTAHVEATRARVKWKLKPTARAHAPSRFAVKVTDLNAFKAIADNSSVLLYVEVSAGKPPPLETTLAELQPQRRYAVAIRAENDAGESDWSAETIFATPTNEEAPQVKELPREDDQSTDCVRLVVSLSDRNVSRLKWSVRDLDLEDSSVPERTDYKTVPPEDGDSPTHLLKICSLRPGGRYRLLLRAVAKNGVASSPRHFELNVPLAPTAPSSSFGSSTPSPPTGLWARPGGSPGELSIGWVAPPPPGHQPLSHFLLEWRAHNSLWHQTEIDVRTRSTHAHYAHLLADLQPGALYELRVAAKASRLRGAFTDIVFAYARAHPPLSPRLLNVTWDCRRTVRIEWTPVAGPSRPPTYILELDSRNATHTNATELVLDGGQLTGPTQHTVRVAALAADGVSTSGWSDEQRFALAPGCRLLSSLCPALSSGGGSPESSESLESPQIIHGPSCEPLTRGPGAVASSRLLAAAAAALLLFLLLVVAVFFTTRRCFNAKALLKARHLEKHAAHHHHHQQQQHHHHLESSRLCADETRPLVGDNETLLPPPPSVPDVPIVCFDDYCQKMDDHDGQGFRAQWDAIESWSAAVEAKQCANENGAATTLNNVEKNRYVDVGAAPAATRIRVETATGGVGYINANYVDSPVERRAWIATQAPLPHTIADFWAMCWQQRVTTIIAITRLVEDGRRKCDRYWPARVGGRETHGAHQVMLIAEEQSAHWTQRTLALRPAAAARDSGDRRVVHQLHFGGWPDRGVPSSVFPLLSFLQLATAAQHYAQTTPVVVHCSAGIGRSGAWMLIDGARRRLQRGADRLNLHAQLVQMRTQRAKLVQTLDQFRFCHRAVQALIVHGGITRVALDALPRYLGTLMERNHAGRPRLEAQFMELCECPHSPSCCPGLLEGELAEVPGHVPGHQHLVGVCSREAPWLWRRLWAASAQTLVLIGAATTPGGGGGGDDDDWLDPSLVDLGAGGSGAQSDDDALRLDRSPDGEYVVIRSREDQLCVRILRVTPSQLSIDVWRHLARVHDHSLQYHSGTIAWLETTQRHDCAGKAAACAALSRLAAEVTATGSLDVLLAMTEMSRARCRLFATRSELEGVYERLVELVDVSQPTAIIRAGNELSSSFATDTPAVIFVDATTPSTEL